MLQKITRALFCILGITGQVRIDENGDRDADYSLNDFNYSTGKFQEVGKHTGSNKTFKPKPGISIHWPNGEPPRDTPECGFHGKGCYTLAGQFIKLFKA